MSDKTASIMGQFMRRRQRLAAQQSAINKITIEYGADGQLDTIYTTPIMRQADVQPETKVDKRRGRPRKEPQ